MDLLQILCQPLFVSLLIISIFSIYLYQSFFSRTNKAIEQCIQQCNEHGLNAKDLHLKQLFRFAGAAAIDVAFLVGCCWYFSAHALF